MTKIKPFDRPIYITRPYLPPLNQVTKKIKEIWNSRWVTNFGNQHNLLEEKLIEFLQVKNVSLFCNGTIALQIGCQALELTGEIITTPFTFPATIHSILQSNCKPVFCDINPEDFNLNAQLLEDLITPKTSAILPVHVFGNPCDIKSIKKIADKNGLKIIYDAAHCFGVEFNGIGIGNFGDISMFSFHATKVFHTIEGGALTFNDDELKQSLYLFKNFGIQNEEEIVLPGLNAKMNEIQAAIGLLNLQHVENEIGRLKNLFVVYYERLKAIEGIKLMEIKKGIKYNYQYFPILINSEEFGINRDKINDLFHKYNVFPRRYFYPLATQYKFYYTEKTEPLPVAEEIADNILCLPIYSGLTESDINKICDILLSFNQS